jgi:hypothetical protein
MATYAPSGFGTGTTKTPCDARPACPACEGLECLCRPRFFAGQLLTEEDLNRLEQYVVAKNRLHNRYLVGWGVACGLEVVCSICDPTKARGRVTVKPGYALSPCGNDIVVCGEVSVDVCEILARCKPDIDLCLGPAADAGDCGGTEQWVLAICYAEKPSKGVTALLNAKDPSAAWCGCGKGGCGCGSGKKGCACGGGGGGSAKGGGCGCGATATKPQKKTSPQCEPTLTCESFTFTAWKAPTKKEQEEKQGAAVARFLCCIRPFTEGISQFPQNGNADQMATWFYDFREALRTFVVEEGLYDCQAAAQISAATFPSNGTPAQIQAALAEIVQLGARVLQKCLCRALLPPCPDPAGGDCVPLALLTLKRNPCDVLEICNLSARKFLMTIPNLEYWLSLLSMFSDSGKSGLLDNLRAGLERLCCGDRAEQIPPDTDIPSAPPVGGPPASTAASGEAIVASYVADPAGPGGPTGKLVLQALGEPGRFANMPAMLLAAAGIRRKDGRPLVSEYEMAHPTDFLLAHEVLAPALRGALPFDIGALIPRPATTPAVADLARQVAELTRTVEELRRNRGG